MTFIIIAVACWGLWGIFDKKALEQSASQNIVITHYILRAIQIPLLIVILNVIKPGWHLSSQTIFWSGIVAVIYAIASVAYLTALSKAEASYVLGITACYPAIAVILSIVFLNEEILFSRIIGVIVVCLGVFAISAPSNNKASGQKLGKSVFLRVTLATLSWAIWGVVDKRAVTIASPLEVCLGKYLWDLLIMPLMVHNYNRQGLKVNCGNAKMLFLCALSAVCLAFGSWAYLTAMSHDCASYVISITACYPALTYFLAIMFLKERFSHLRSAGIALIILGGFLVQSAPATAEKGSLEIACISSPKSSAATLPTRQMAPRNSY
jgi:uncharacterized membrane protein